MKLHKMISRIVNNYPIEGLSESQALTFKKIISEINQTCFEFENDFASLKHSMEANSEELIEKNNEIRKQNDQIEDQRLRLISSSKMSALGEMASGIAHEIKNPLSIIKLYVEQIGHLIQKGPENSTIIKQRAEDVSKTVMRIAKIIDGLKNIAQGETQDSLEMTSVSSIIESILPFCKERLKQNGMELQINCPPQISLPCRPIQISQILLNLMNNSYYAISSLQQKWIRITVTEYAEFVEIIVSDSGPGLSEEIQSRLFQPFFSTKGTKGTGLGLSIAMRLAKAHGGTLTYKKSENTAFALKLPKKASA